MAQSIPIANGFYVSDSLPISNQRCVNFYPNTPQVPSSTDANLFPTPGINQILSLSTINSCRGAHVMNEIPYFIIGTTLYRLNRTFDVDNNEIFSTDSLGTIDGVEFVTMADNGTQLCICARPDAATTGKSYIFTTDPDTLTQITDPDFDGPADSVKYIDGFFSFIKSDGKKFFQSQLADGLNYDALDFSTASADPDKIRAQAVHNNQLYIIGSETTEIFRNIGRSPAPFQRIPGAIIQLGIFSVNSIQSFAGSLVFIGGSQNESPAVWMISGGSKQKLSTTAIDNELSKLTDMELDDVFSWTYGESGSYFYGFNTPYTTFVYDATNQRWHERQSHVKNKYSAYRVSHMVTAYGRILVGDRIDGRIGELDKDTYTDYNHLSRRYITTMPFDNNGDPVFVAAIEAVCESGVGLTDDVELMNGVTATGDPISIKTGKNPQITLAWSDDGGGVFEGWLSRSLGKKGERKKRQQWRKVGRFPRSRSLLLEIAAPVKAVIIKVEVQVA